MFRCLLNEQIFLDFQCIVDVDGGVEEAEVIMVDIVHEGEEVLTG